MIRRLLCCAAILPLLLTNSARSSEPVVADPFRWSVVETGGPARKVFPSEVDADTIFVWSTDHFSLSKDGGKTFKALPVNPELKNVTTLLIDPSQPATLYAGTASSGVFLSTNEGSAWSKLGGTEAGLAHLHIHGLVFSRFDSSFKTLYAMHSAAKAGISVSNDGGKTWQTLAKDYGVDRMIFVESTIFLAGAHPAGGDEVGFFRLDPTRGSFRVCVDTPSAMNESLFGSRMWLGTADAGIKLSDDFGVTKTDAGPPEIYVVSMAAGYTSSLTEAQYIYEPNKEGVLTSSDGFKTWKKLNTGLYVGEWVTDGAGMSVNADGAVLYACINDKLYRGTGIEHKLIAHVAAQPPAVVAGEGAVTFSCVAAKGAKVEIDLSPIGGAPAVPMTEQAGTTESTYTVLIPEVAANVFGLKDRKGAPLPGRVPLTVKVSLDDKTESRLALLTVLKPTHDFVAWNGESHSFLSTWGNTMSVHASKENPFSGDSHLRVEVLGPGQAGASWKNPGANFDGDDVRYHRLLTFCIRSDTEGPSDLKLCFRDDGRRLGHGNGNRSNQVPLSAYLKSVGPRYQFVAIPLSDLLFGSPAAPDGVCELMFDAPAGSAPRNYDLDDIAIYAKPHPILSNTTVTLSEDGQNATLSAFSTGLSGGEPSVTVITGEKKFELKDVNHSGQFSALVPIAQISTGTHAFKFIATDTSGSGEISVETFLPRRTHRAIGRAGADFKLDPKLAEFANVASFKLSDAELGLTARVLYGNNKLYCALEVKDAAFTGKDLATPETADKLAQGPSVELFITSPSAYAGRASKGPSPADRRIVFAMSTKKTLAVLNTTHLPAAGVKAESGYVIVAQIPFDALKHGNEPCDFALGKSTRVEWRLRGANGKELTWSAPDAAAAGDRENWGLAYFGEEPGAPRFSYAGLNEKTITLVSNKRLNRAQAETVANYAIPGVKIEKATLERDGRTLRLTSTAAWKTEPTTLTFTTLTAEDGMGPPEPLAFTATPGRPSSGFFLTEFLIGKAVQNIDPLKLSDPYYDEKAQPTRGSAWSYAESESGAFNLLELVGPLNNSVVAAHVYIYSDAERNAQLWLGSDDGIRAALNGQPIHINPATRGCAPDQDKIKIKLNKGWNALMLTISQGGGGWGFYCRLMDENGAAPKGLSYSADNPVAPSATAKEP